MESVCLRNSKCYLKMKFKRWNQSPTKLKVSFSFDQKAYFKMKHVIRIRFEEMLKCVVFVQPIIFYDSFVIDLSCVCVCKNWKFEVRSKHFILNNRQEAKQHKQIIQLMKYCNLIITSFLTPEFKYQCSLSFVFTHFCC